jgi:hypothetical protein
VTSSDLDPRRVKHKFEKAGYNAFFCNYCSAPRPSHKKCGHSIFVNGCETCREAIFSKDQANYRRRKNLKAMKKWGIACGGSR